MAPRRSAISKLPLHDADLERGLAGEAEPAVDGNHELVERGAEAAFLLAAVGDPQLAPNEPLDILA
jgi:hypothetical protein